MKIFILLSCTGNGRQYEDYTDYTNVVGVYSTLELAESAQSLLPTKVDVGCVSDDEILMVEPSYTIYEKELNLMPSLTPTSVEIQQELERKEAIAIEQADMLEHQKDDYQSAHEREARTNGTWFE